MPRFNVSEMFVVLNDDETFTDAHGCHLVWFEGVDDSSPDEIDNDIEAAAVAGAGNIGARRVLTIGRDLEGFESFDDLMRVVLTFFNDAVIDQESDGNLTVHLNLTEDPATGRIVPIFRKEE